jgi:hypothetical protein
MGWCHYQGSDGNCNHTNEHGLECCPDIEKAHLFLLKGGGVADEERVMREQLLDDLGIITSGNSATKALRIKLLETEVRSMKKNIHKGKRNVSAEYEYYDATIFKHDIKWCRCHMLPSDIIPGQRVGTLTWKEGFRLYSQKYKKQVAPPERPSPKQDPSSFTPLAQSLRSETDDMQQRITSLVQQVSELKVTIQVKENNLKNLEEEKAKLCKQLETQSLELQEKKTLDEQHAQTLTTVSTIARNNYEQALLWKATAQQAQERELSVCETQHDMRQTLKTIENEYQKNKTAMPWDHTIIEAVCKGANHPEEWEKFCRLLGKPNVKGKKMKEPTQPQMARWILKKRRLTFGWFALLCAPNEHCSSFRKALDSLELKRTSELQRQASGMGTGMSKTSKKEALRVRAKTFDKDLDSWLRHATGMSPNENDWDEITKGLVLLFDDDFFR